MSFHFFQQNKGLNEEVQLSAVNLKSVNINSKTLCHIAIKEIRKLQH